METDTPSLCWGVFNRRPRWGLSARGWLLAFGLVLAAGGIAFVGAYPFLAITDRQNGELLVVEGWLRGYAIRASIREFHAGHYQRVVTTGGPFEGALDGGEASSTAALAAARLTAAGLDARDVAIASGNFVARDRTYASALGLRDWLRTNAPQVRRIDVLTADAHARRTRLLYQEALGPAYTVGVVSVPSPNYEPRHWWRYSEGVRTVLGEAISYLYARILFTPPHDAAPDSNH